MRRADVLRQAAQTADLTIVEALSMSNWRMAVANGSPFWVARATTMRGVVAFWQGDWAAARQHMREGARVATGGFWFGSHHGVLSLLLASEGSATEALATIDQVSDSLPQPGRVNMLGQWTLALFSAETAAVLRDSDRARQYYPLIVEALATGTLLRMYDGSLIQRTAGMAAAAAGLHEPAERHFQQALSQAWELPHMMERSGVRYSYARYLIDRGGSGDLELARTFLEEAAAGYRSIGMPRHLAMVEDLLGAAQAR
jgi:hypothetical protein